MKILSGERWADGFPDHYRRSGDYRIETVALRNLERLDGLYFVRAASLRTLWNYVQDVGPVTVARKVLSRRRERARNRKFVSCGLGRVIEAPEDGRFRAGALVAFLLPIGPACMERVVLPEELLVGVDPRQMPAHSDAEILYAPGLPEATSDACWDEVRAWTPYSGHALRPQIVRLALKQAVELMGATDWADARSLPVEPALPATTRVATNAKISRSDSRGRAVLFGYGNYAKTTILPYVRPFLRVDRVHEIDPTQMTLGAPEVETWDSSPRPGPVDETTDAYLIAGYHHTHAELACEALRRGASAVIEKPIATSRQQLHQLLAAMRETEGRVFSCFQRRYHPFNELALRDLEITPGDPVSYHCIVYEVPLPDLHWYRWPNSRTRLTSNGCHWVDHFLYLNDFAAVQSYEVSGAPDGTTNCSVTLANGAFFSMLLTDRGSERIGMQDYIELRGQRASAKIINGSRYESENGQKILRKVRVNKIDAYRKMYETIGSRITSGADGDSLRSVQLSTTLTLDLERRLTELARLSSPGAVAREPETASPVGVQTAA